ncbi:MAG: hypothetical protein KatS3mg027_0903 [Bacteroidia bacterium]|nr:MAG: hypothetical protein KatS3mg027_0903 [Bacteroidia bacterium]
MKINKFWRKIIIDWHRDIGYLISGLILIYCISGIALNHIDDFNPDFIVQRDTVQINIQLENVNNDLILKLSALVGETKFKVWEKPTKDQLKIYYDNATLHIYLNENKGVYEQLKKRPLLYHVNLIHRNSVKGWKWASDIFSTLLIILTITGLFILKGKYSFMKRGVWFVLLGMFPPIIAIVFFIYFQK